MNILFVYPRYPDTFWSFRHALKFIAKKAAYPPLGLLTVASLLPREWEKKLVDMNADDLNDEDIAWADYVFISAMDVQRQSACEVVKRCHQLGTKMVAGGPLFTTGHEDFPEVDHFVLGEAETLMSRLVTDLEKGRGRAFLPVGREAGHSEEPDTSLGAYRYQEIRYPQPSVLARLPL